MVSKTLFKTKTAKKCSPPKANTTNLAGGRAYSLTDEAALCQYVATGTFNGTYYASGDAHLKTIEGLVANVSPELIAKAAVYGFETARMKDLPAYLLAVLAARGELDLLRKAFPRVIKNVKMLCNFVQIVRSGQTGRKSFGTAVKKLIRDFLKSREPSDLFKQQFGHANPSVTDIIKMVHPKPSSPSESALYAYLVGKESNKRNLPKIVKDFEAFKLDSSKPLPELDYRSLSNCNLTPAHWKSIAENMPWNMLRMNLNKLAREGVFNDKKLVKEVISKISDPTQVATRNVFPYQLMTTFQNLDTAVPNTIGMAIQDALDIATSKIPDLGDSVAVLVDVSGSMSGPVTGNRGTATTKTTCRDVAALIASCVLRKNPDAWIVTFDTSARQIKLNPRDSVMTNAGKISTPGGGTNVACGLNYIRKNGCKAKTVIIVSDNESWFNTRTYGYGLATGAAEEWKKYSTVDVPTAKLFCIDLTPNATTQVPDSRNVLNIGGFTDNVFDVVNAFVYGGKDHFVDVVKKVKL